MGKPCKVIHQAPSAGAVDRIVRISLQQAVQKQAQLSEFLSHIHFVGRGHVDAQRVIVSDGF